MIKANIIGPFVGDGLTTMTAFRHKVFADFAPIKLYISPDNTRLPDEELIPEPNLTEQTIEVENSLFWQIDNHPDYFVSSWEEI